MNFEDGKMLLKVVELNHEDHYDEVLELDKVSGNDVMFWIDSGMAYGLIRGMELIGYLTLGYTDDCGEDIESHPHHHSDARILSNVFIKEKFRNIGLSLFMLQEALEKVPEVTYLNLLDGELKGLYERFGFKPINDITMVKL